MEAKVLCPTCDGQDIKKFGLRKGKQIYKCNNTSCIRITFRSQYSYKGCNPKVKKQIHALTKDGNSARAIGRILSISKDTVTKSLKKGN